MAVASPPKPPVISGSRAQQISQIEAWIVQQTGRQDLGDSYVAFCNKPASKSVSAKECYVGWFIEESKLAPDLFKDLGQGLGGAGDLAGAGEKSLTSLNPLAGLFQANIWERVALVGLGIILIAVGVAQLTHAVPVATKIATAVK